MKILSHRLFSLNQLLIVDCLMEKYGWTNRKYVLCVWLRSCCSCSTRLETHHNIICWPSALFSSCQNIQWWRHCPVCIWLRWIDGTMWYWLALYERCEQLVSLRWCFDYELNVEDDWYGVIGSKFYTHLLSIWRHIHTVRVHNTVYGLLRLISLPWFNDVDATRTNRKYVVVLIRCRVRIDEIWSW